MFIVGVTLILLGGALAQDCDSIKTDECGLQVFPFLVDTTRIPADQAELTEICKTLHKGDTCIKDYLTKCPNVIKKDVSVAVLDSLHSTVEDLCTGNLGKRFLTHGTCLKENLVKNFTCNADAIKWMESIAVYEPASEKLKLTCCAYLSLDRCLQGSTAAACDSRASRVIRNLFQSYAIFMVDRCLPFLSEPEKCDLSVLNNVQLPSSRRPKTFLPALIDVASVAF